jgi:4-carboxymuconolactone decarboxylase
MLAARLGVPLVLSGRRRALSGKMHAMTRLPSLQREQLDEEGRAAWDSIVETRPNIEAEDGGLMGPFNPWVTAPGIGAKLADLGASLRFQSSIERRLLEVAIITVGAHWRAEFEWWAHSRMARHHGVAPAVIEAIASGHFPEFERDDERVVYTVARELVENGRIDQPTFDAARQLLGDRGSVELVTLCGYYTLVSFTLNGFDVALPPGETPTWS